MLDSIKMWFGFQIMYIYTKHLKNGTKQSDFCTKHPKISTKPRDYGTKPSQKSTNFISPYTQSQQTVYYYTLPYNTVIFLLKYAQFCGAGKLICQNVVPTNWYRSINRYFSTKLRISSNQTICSSAP